MNPLSAVSKAKGKKGKRTAHGQEEDTSVLDLTVFAPNQQRAPKDAERCGHERPKTALFGLLARVGNEDRPYGGENVRGDGKELGLDLGVSHAGQ